MATLVRWEPFRGLRTMGQEADRLFDEFFGRPLVRWEGEEDGVRLPLIDIAETDQELVLKAEMPGLDKDKIHVEVLPDRVSITGEVSEEREEKETTHYCRERVWSRFERSIPLPVEVASEQVKASYRNGLLEIHLPKTERAKADTPKEVKIE